MVTAGKQKGHIEDAVDARDERGIHDSRGRDSTRHVQRGGEASPRPCLGGGRGVSQRPISTSPNGVSVLH